MVQTAVLAGGCFWCTEAIYRRLNGVISVESGYSGGSTINPTYDTVSKGNTGHAEAVLIKFNSKVIDYQTILDVFFATHDPTTSNKQGNDIGSQYRSAIFYTTHEQEKIASDTINILNSNGAFRSNILTEVVPLNMFWKAEAFHQNYFKDHSTAPYCQIVIFPKIQKFIDKYPDKVKRV